MAQTTSWTAVAMELDLTLSKGAIQFLLYRVQLFAQRNLYFGGNPMSISHSAYH
jgi:hypothetical protein